MDGMDLERQLVAGVGAGHRRVTHARDRLDGRVRSTLFRVGVHVVHLVSSAVGDDVIGRAVRARVLRLAGATLGRESTVHGGTYLSHPAHLTLGFHAMLNRNCYLDLGAPITFGDYAGAGHGATFITTIHGIVPGMNVGVGMSVKPITVGDRAWIGANATVLPGVTIGHDAIVAAASLVTRNVPPNTLVSGNPARIIRREVRSWLRDVAGDDADPARVDGHDGDDGDPARVDEPGDDVRA